MNASINYIRCIIMNPLSLKVWQFPPINSYRIPISSSILDYKHFEFCTGYYPFKTSKDIKMYNNWKYPNIGNVSPSINERVLSKEIEWMEWRDSLVEEWISLNSNSSRVKIHYSASEISSGLLDIHSKRSDHWRHYVTTQGVKIEWIEWFF